MRKHFRDVSLTNREYLLVSFPFILSTVTQPLLSAVNTAMMGQLGDAAYIAGVSVGALLFDNIYFLFGFLRVSTAGYASQALGSGVEEDRAAAFFRPLMPAIAGGVLCVLLQAPMIRSYLGFVRPAADVAHHAVTYYNILIWGAPFVLVNCVSLGWLMGTARTRAFLFLQISMNLLNIGLDFLFVTWMGMRVEGVAWATLISQLYGFIFGLWLIYRNGRFFLKELPWRRILDPKAMWEMVRVNANLVIRTAGLLLVNNTVTAVGAGLGTVYLAANTVLLQIINIISCCIDGIANAASIFTGQAIGRKDIHALDDTVMRSVQWMLIFTGLSCAIYALNAETLIGLFTDIQEVKSTARIFSAYVLLYPVVACCRIVFFGIFAGATYTAPIRNMILLSVVGFFVCRYTLVPMWGNHGLWISYMVFYAMQSLILWIQFMTHRDKIESFATGS